MSLMKRNRYKRSCIWTRINLPLSYYQNRLYTFYECFPIVWYKHVYICLRLNLIQNKLSIKNYQSIYDGYEFESFHIHRPMMFPVHYTNLYFSPYITDLLVVTVPCLILYWRIMKSTHCISNKICASLHKYLIITSSNICWYFLLKSSAFLHVTV